MSSSESRKKQQIIELLDPSGIDQSLLTLDFEKLKKEMDRRTNCLIEIKHEDYFDINDILISGMNRDDEFALAKFHLNKKEDDIKKLSLMLREKEDELYLRERNINILERKSKSPSKTKIESEFEQDNKINSSPSLYQPFLYRIENKNVQSEQLITSTIIDSLGLSPGSTINGSLTEEEAILKAIQQSEKEANDVIDRPFEESQSRITEIKTILSNKITAESLKAEGKSPYYMLQNKPENVTDELLDDLYKMLVDRNFSSVKEFFANKELPVNILRWIKTLKFNDTTLTQMLLSKPNYIHKCLRPYE